MKFPIPGVLVGHWTDSVAKTGCTAILFPPGTVASGAVSYTHLTLPTNREV